MATSYGSLMKHSIQVHLSMHYHTMSCTTAHCTCVFITNTHTYTHTDVSFASRTCTRGRGSWRLEIWQCGSLQWLYQQYQFLWVVEFEEVCILIFYKQRKRKPTYIVRSTALFVYWWSGNNQTLIDTLYTGYLDKFKNYVFDEILIAWKTLIKMCKTFVST